MARTGARGYLSGAGLCGCSHGGENRSVGTPVKFLLNMNLPPAFGSMLASEGHEWRHVANLGMSRASDAAILAEAKSHGECVITHDLDYGQLLAFSGDSTPSVVIFRLRRAETALL